MRDIDLAVSFGKKYEKEEVKEKEKISLKVK
jgi:hypothetical protein